MNAEKVFIRILLLIALACTAGGCAGKQPGAEEGLAGKGVPVVYIHPLNPEDYRRASVGVLPFQVPAGVAEEQGLRMAALFKDTLLGKRTFPTVRQVTTSYGDLDEAVAIGRQHGVDLVLAGQVTQVLAGTGFGGGRVSVAVRLLATESGQTIWYLEESAEQPVAYPDFSFWGRLRSAVASQPIHRTEGGAAVPNLLAQIAWDMAEVLAGARQLP